MIENFKSQIRQFLPRHCLFPLVSLGDFLRKKAFSRNPEITVNRTDINDLMIAATARAYRRTVLTENVSDFGQVSGVKTKNWKLEEV